MENYKDIVTQVQELFGNLTSLEAEKKIVTESTENFVKAVKEKVMALEEKENKWEERGNEIAKLEAEVAMLRSREIDQGAFARLVVEKVLQTTNFGKQEVLKMSATAINIGKQEVLKSLMSECPQLRKQRIGWDLYAKEMANKLQQKLLKEDHEFQRLTEIVKQVVPLT